MAIVVLSVLISIVFIALLGLSFQVVVLHEIAQSAHEAVQSLKAQLAPPEERQVVALPNPATDYEANLAALRAAQEASARLAAAVAKFEEMTSELMRRQTEPTASR